MNLENRVFFSIKILRVQVKLGSHDSRRGAYDPQLEILSDSIIITVKLHNPISYERDRWFRHIEYTPNYIN